MLSKIFAALLILTLPPAASYGGYRLTDLYFQRKMIPLPFEQTGIAVGAGCFFWTLSLLVLVLLQKKRSSS